MKWSFAASMWIGGDNRRLKTYRTRARRALDGWRHRIGRVAWV